MVSCGARYAVRVPCANSKCLCLTEVGWEHCRLVEGSCQLLVGGEENTGCTRGMGSQICVGGCDAVNV